MGEDIRPPYSLIARWRSAYRAYGLGVLPLPVGEGIRLPCSLIARWRSAYRAYGLGVLAPPVGEDIRPPCSLIARWRSAYRAYGLGVLPLPVGEGRGEGIRLLRSMSRFVIVFFFFRLISKNSFSSPAAGVMVG
ncbi:hypothetical protein ENTCAN_07981 [Enterobacter cancerogenus ATCC 35316]|nr:hypothetical protein ENTCAN_07981 [Enterobacter cancerogenus ATCC 35316]